MDEVQDVLSKRWLFQYVDGYYFLGVSYDSTEHADFSFLDEVQELVEQQCYQYHRPFIEFLYVDIGVELVN